MQQVAEKWVKAAAIARNIKGGMAATLKYLKDNKTPAQSWTESVLGRRHRAPSLVACSQPMRTVEQLASRAAATELKPR